MKIKENHFDNYLWLKKNIIRLYQRKIIISSIIFITLTAYSLTLIFYGMELQKVQVAAKWKQVLYDGAVTKLNIIPNYFKGIFSNPDKFSIDLSFKDLQKLDYTRSAALNRGKITENDKNLEVNASLRLLGKTYKVQLSPTGQNLDMIGDPNKYAYKVKVKDEDRIYGMKEFKLIPPKSRNHIVEWIGHKIEKNEGLIALRYDFIQLSINGDSKGIYSIEEHFNTELIENNHYKEGIMFFLSDDVDMNIIPYNKKNILNNEILNSQYKLLERKWAAFLSGDIEASKVFDIEKYAKFFAIVDLLDGYHAAIKINLKMYLNPVTNLIEPIAREYNSLRYSDGPPNSRIMIDRINKNNGNDYVFIFSELSEEISFIKFYLNNLSRFSKKEYLDDLFKINNEEINKKLNIIYKDEPYYAFPKEYMYLRQEYIKNTLLYINTNLKSYYNTDKDELIIQVVNKTNLPIELMGITESDSIIYNFNHYIIDDDTSSFSTKIKYQGINNYKLIYRLPDLIDSEKETILIPKSFTNDKIFPNLSILNKPNVINKDYLLINEINKTIAFTYLDIVIDSDLIIPKNYKLIGQPGLNIDLIDNSSILSYSPIELIGNEQNPIVIYSSDNTGNGIVVMGPKEKSIFDYVIFNNISNPKYFGWELPGAITVYESNIIINNSHFMNNKSEDYLNIIKSKYEISRCSFENVYSDAFDGDFSNGFISNSKFSNCGNDAIDISGSNLIIDSIYIDNTGDKGVSVGERSKLKGNRINIINSEIGITSKDYSIVEIDEITLKNTKLGFTAYQKKPEYGPGEIIVNNYEINNVETNFLIEKGSSMVLNGKNVEITSGKIENILYGVKYGKSTR